MRWRPSNTAIFPSIAALRRADGLQIVSPLGIVDLCCTRSRAVMSYKYAVISIQFVIPNVMKDKPDITL